MSRKGENSIKQHKKGDKNHKIRKVADKIDENYDKQTGINCVQAVNNLIERAS